MVDQPPPPEPYPQPPPPAKRRMSKTCLMITLAVGAAGLFLLGACGVIAVLRSPAPPSPATPKPAGVLQPAAPKPAGVLQPVRTVEGTQSKKSHLFNLTGAPTRLRYEVTSTSGVGNAVIFNVHIMREGQTDGDLVVSTLTQGSEETALPQRPGAYYLDIGVGGGNEYKVIVEEQVNGDRRTPWLAPSPGRPP